MMKRLATLLGILWATLLAACGHSPTAHDVVGVWSSPDGAVLTIEESGMFTATALPVGVFTTPDQKGPPFSGHGIWKLKQGSPYLEIRLGFDEIGGKPASREVIVLVSGSGSSIYLYQWKEEEGGERYKLERKAR